jgi:methyl-accepting chemotaxis protein WspA
MVGLSTFNLAVILVLSWMLLIWYRIDSPLYNSLVRDRELMSEMEPDMLAISRPWAVIGELATPANLEEVKSLEGRLRVLQREYQDHLADWKARYPEGKIKDALLRTVGPAEEVFRQAWELVRLAGDPGKKQSLPEFVENRIKPSYDQHVQAISEVVQLLRDRIKDAEDSARKTTNFWLDVMVVISILSMVTVVALGWLTVASVAGSTTTLLGRVREMASGASDLTARIPVHGSDEIGQLAEGINAMMAKIQAVVQRVRESSIQLLSTASEIAAAARQQEATMNELGSSTTQIAAAVQEISSTTRELAGTMSEVNERANHASSLASAGRSGLGRMEATMQQLVDSTVAISGKLALIREKADSINLVVSTITKVADQTNLLSINAAIEAEKAGEYGRGFLVVAREIRRLADQTAVATLDIESMVRQMHDAVSAGVMQMDKFTEEVRVGAGRVGEINGQTGQIIEEARTLGERFQLVNEGMHNQALGAEQINEAMRRVSTSTRQTAAALEEFNRATSHLRSSVEMLNQEISQFTI